MVCGLRSRLSVTLTLFGALSLSATAFAQTVYHLHAEASATSGAKQLQVAGPDTAYVTLQSADYKNITAPASATIASFDTQAGVPNSAGTISSGAAVSFSVWMRKTANWGTFYPQASLYLNNTPFSGGTLICSATGATALTTTFVKYTWNCTAASQLTMVASDRWFLAVGLSMTAGPGNKSVRVEVRIEGTLNGNYDSTVTSPPIVPPA